MKETIGIGVGLALFLHTVVAQSAELGFEPQLVTRSEAIGAIAVEATAGLDEGQRIARSYDGFRFGGLALAYAPLSFLSFGATYEPSNERAFPVTIGYGLGPLGLSHELAYHAVIGGDDQWTFDSELAIDLGGGFGLFTTVRTTSSKTGSDVVALHQGGLSFAPTDRLSLIAGLGQGVRDTPFETAETAGLFALELSR